jgi:hypothetical protein
MHIHGTPQYRKAFIQYLRKGTPIAISLKETERATEYYVWRTQGDDRVRPEHSAREGRIFSSEDSGPGEDYGCRCWEEPYYGKKPAYEGISEAQSPNDGLPHFNVPNQENKIPEKINIFIGGFFDRSGLGDNHPVYESYALQHGVFGRNYYISHDQTDRALALIHALPKDMTINIIGHSWGADSAALMVLKIPNRVDTLVTVDPVSVLQPHFETVRSSVNSWININAVGADNSTALSWERIRQGGFVAGIGNSWNNNPQGIANIHIQAPYNHAAFDEMMRYQMTTEDSAEDLLNK